MTSDWVWKFFSLVGFASPILAFAFRNWISEKIKIGFQKDLEAFKINLDQQKEVFRVQLARETERLSLHKNSISEVYPQIFEKIVIASGNVCGLIGLQHSADYSSWSKEQIKEHLVYLNVPADRALETIALFDSDKPKMIDGLNKFNRQNQVSKALSLHQDAKNFLILKSLFVSSLVKEKGFEILDGLNVIMIETVHLEHGDFSKAHDASKSNGPLCNQLEELMRSEIFGSGSPQSNMEFRQ